MRSSVNKTGPGPNKSLRECDVLVFVVLMTWLDRFPTSHQLLTFCHDSTSAGKKATDLYAETYQTAQVLAPRAGIRVLVKIVEKNDEAD